jgi:hypothetical protein
LIDIFSLIPAFAQQNSSGYSCNDFTDLSRVKVSTIWVNFHFILDGNGDGNFRRNDDGNGNSNVTGITIAQSLIDDANAVLEHLEQNISKNCLGQQNGFVSDAKYRLAIYPPENIESGIHFISDQTLYDQNREPDFTDASYLKQTYSAYGSKVVDVFMRAVAPGSNCNVWGEANLVIPICQTWCLWYYYISNDPGTEAFPGLLNHEILHCMGFKQEANSSSCDYYDIDKDEEAQTGNNIMRNNGGAKNALTPKQFNKLHTYLPILPYSNHDVLCDDDDPDIIIESGQTVTWNNPSRIASEVIVEPLATLIINCDVFTNKRILVKRSGKLIVEGATISSLCPDVDFWPGIQVEGSTKSHSQVSIFDPPISGDPGVVILNNAVISHAIVGVTTKSYEHEWETDYWGGIIVASVSTFSNNRKAVEFYPYRTENSSFFTECDFSSSNGYAGISMWDVHGVEIRDCDFGNMGPGITLFNPNGSSAPTTITGDVGIITIDASPMIYDNCTFQDLTHAIDAKSSIDLNLGRDGFRVGIMNGSYRPNLFENNTTHIFSLGTIGMDIINNRFAECNEGIYFSGKSQYNMISNQVSSFRYGLISRFPGALSNLIQGNKWVSTKDPSTGNFFRGDVQNVELVQNCYSVTKEDHLVWGARLKNQGTQNVPAVNLFSHKPVSSYDLISLTLPLNYWHEDPELNPNLDLRLIPLCAANNRAPSCSAFSRHLNQKSDGSKDPRINCILDEYNFPNDSIEEEYYSDSLFRFWNDKQFEYTQVLDGGNQALLLDGLNNDPDGTATYDNLIAASPFLTFEVLDVLICSGMDTSSKLQILTANAPIPEYFNSSLENYYATETIELLNSDYYHSYPAPRDSVHSLYDHANYQKQYQLFALLNHYSGMDQLDSLVSLLSAMEDFSKTQYLLDYYRYRNDFELCDSIIANTTAMNQDEEDWLFVADLSIRLYRDPQNFLIHQFELDSLNALALSYCREASAASALLYILEEKLYHISGDVNAPNAPLILGPDQQMGKQKSILKIVPNPAQDRILLKANDIITAMEICAIDGKMFFRKLLSNGTQDLALDIKSLKSGLYMVKAILNNGNVISEKLIKL